MDQDLVQKSFAFEAGAPEAKNQDCSHAVGFTERDLTLLLSLFGHRTMHPVRHDRILEQT